MFYKNLREHMHNNNDNNADKIVIMNDDVRVVL